MLKAVIFDLDGVLSDSEGVYVEAVSDIMGRFDISLSPEEHLSLRGLSSTLVWELLAERYSLPVSPAELLRLEQDYVDELIKTGNVSPVPFAFPLLMSLKECGIKAAVATSNFGYRAAMVIKQNEAESFVDALVSSELVENLKPAPDLFLLSARLLDEEPENCLVIEDTLFGVEAAKNAGMKVILYAPEELYDTENCKADMILDSFEGVSCELFEKCFS